MKPLLIVALSAALLGGCSSTPLVSGSADQVQAPTEAISQSTLPPGATMKPELSLIIGSGDQWVGRVVATVGKDIDAAIRFFYRHLPRPGVDLDLFGARQIQLAGLHQTRSDRHCGTCRRRLDERRHRHPDRRPAQCHRGSAQTPLSQALSAIGQPSAAPAL